MKQFLTATALLAVFACAAVAEDSNKHPWASFKVGSWVKTKSVTATEMAGQKTETTTTTTTKLIELTDSDAVVEIETEMSMMMGGKETKVPAQKTTMKYPIKTEAAPNPTDKPATPAYEQGEEELEVAGKKLKCTWVKMDTDANGMKTSSKSWSCTDVPGWFIKSDSETTGPMTTKSTTTLIEFEVK